VRAEIVATGTELLLGQKVNENARYLSEILADLGIAVRQHVVVGDDAASIDAALTAALARSELVVTTGGLGPTEADLTRERVAAVTGRPLVLHRPSLEAITSLFARIGRPMPESNRKQALCPEGAVVIPNPLGTAPGAIVETGGRMIVMLPGPPAELRAMVEQTVAPFLAERLQQAGQRSVIRSRVLRLVGIGESAAMARIADLAGGDNPTLSPMATGGEVWLRITARAACRRDADTLIDTVEEAVRPRLGDHIYGRDAETLEAVVGRVLAAHRQTLAVAESCTGGLVAHRLTSVPGSSAYFERGLVVYSNRSKTELADVAPELLARHGAVSAEVAGAMAEGVRRSAGTDFGLAITGIAGPGGGTEAKPVGLVFFGLAGGGPTLTDSRMFPGDRKAVKLLASNRALELLWRRLRD